jgi:hypothetical protein
MVLKRLEPRVTFVALWALDEVVGPYTSRANTAGSSTNVVSARSWGYGFTHAGSGQRYCEQIHEERFTGKLQSLVQKLSGSSTKALLACLATCKSTIHTIAKSV